MTKRMREILSKIETKTAMAKEYMEGENKDIAKAEAIMTEVEELQKEYSVEEKIYNNEKKAEALTEEEEKKVKEDIEAQKAEDKDEDEKGDTTKSFAKAVRTLINKVMSEGANETGGYTVPEDIETEVQRLRESRESLRDLITVKQVTTLSGQETYKTRGQATGFGAVEEGGKIPKAGTPKFSRKSWKVTKYGGYIAATSELLEDSDANIRSFITEWLADEDRATWNNLILAIIAKKTAVDLKDLDGIKKTLNITLGSLFKATSKIITNDDGLNYLDTLKDNNGRPLLNPDPTDSVKMQLRAGATVIPVKVYDNETLKTVESKVPFIIGDLKEGIKGFERKGLQLMASNTAVVGSGDDQINAFEEDYTLIRGLERLDIIERDDKAYVNGYITVTETPAEETSGEKVV